MPLTLKEQRKIVRMIPAVAKSMLKKHCKACEMGGSGLLDVLKSAGKFLVKTIGPIAREIGPVVLKELVLPLLKAKISGKGTSVAGRGLTVAGSGLQLSGQRRTGQRRAHCPNARTRKTKTGGSGLKLGGQGRSQAGKKQNPWMIHVKKVKKQNPSLAFKDVLKKASKSYKK